MSCPINSDGRRNTSPINWSHRNTRTAKSKVIYPKKINISVKNALSSLIQDALKKTKRLRILQITTSEEKKCYCIPKGLNHLSRPTEILFEHTWGETSPNDIKLTDIKHIEDAKQYDVACRWLNKKTVSKKLWLVTLEKTSEGTITGLLIPNEKHDPNVMPSIVIQSDPNDDSNTSTIPLYMISTLTRIPSKKACNAFKTQDKPPPKFSSRNFPNFVEDVKVIAKWGEHLL